MALLQGVTNALSSPGATSDGQPTPNAQRMGKFNELDGQDGFGGGGEWSMPNPSANTLLRANADLSPALIARAIAQRLKRIGVDADVAARMDAYLAILDAKERAMTSLQLGAPPTDRQPWFCSGCPHNTSTLVPEGSRAMAGIGCHFMTIWMDRATVGFTQMGGEGVPWVGQQPFVHDQHMFANLGDGTYFHSGLLAVRQSIAAGVNITYKILYNDAVAMTGGQQVGERPEGHSVVQIAQSMRAEGAQRIVVVTDEPDKYAGVRDLPTGVSVEHRDALDRIQREFRTIPGTTVIIYDQTCATEKRRRRKRGTLVDPAVRVVINELVCEGCGDCGVQSNCISVEPLETNFGRKRQINQSTCNKDVSCVKGFCPSFVTVEGGSLRKKKGAVPASAQQVDILPAPPIADLAMAHDGVWGLVVAGVGGTGVITIGQLLGVAAHMEGKGIVTQDAGGLAQKGGATWSHVLIGQTQDAIRTTRVGMACADLVIGCDPIVTAGKETSMRLRAGRSHVVMNSHSAPTAAFVKNANWSNPGEACIAHIADTLQDPSALGCVDAEGIASQLLGDSIFTNPVMLGFAWQKGWIPLQEASILRAMELNAVAVDKNKAAFQWGRRAAHDPASVARALQPAQTVQWLRAPQENAASLDSFVEERAEFLTGYQNAAYARRYTDFVARAQRAEQALADAAVSSLPLTFAVARYLFKLMAYKDEYEVARLHSAAAFRDKIGSMFEGDYQVHYHLAPPLLAKTNDKGELQKQKFGPYMAWAFTLLAPLKVLRGTALDPFGRTDERRLERALLANYQDTLNTYLEKLRADNQADALAFAKLPEQIRGFGHVKAHHIAAVRPQWVALGGKL